MSLSKLPRELILAVGDNLPISSLSCLLRTCHSLHRLLWQALTTRITTEQLATTVLQWGIGHNHLPTVKLALAHNSPWHTKALSGVCYSALADACGRNHLDIVAALITHFGPTILTTNQQPNGRFCHVNQLEVAIRCNHLGRTTLLLESGAPVNWTVCDKYRGRGRSPLGFAAMYGSAEIAEALIRHGAVLHPADRSLCFAVNCGRWDVVKVLLRSGVSVWEPQFEWSDYCPLGKRTEEEIVEWSDYCPLGKRTEEEIERWVASGIAYMGQCMAND